MLGQFCREVSEVETQVSVGVRKKNMRAFFVRFYAGSFLLLYVFFGCSTEKANETTPRPREYLILPHPNGSDLMVLQKLFTDPLAPTDKDFAETCDADYRKLKTLTPSPVEVAEGLRELVQNNPGQYHWCFYAKMRDLERDLAAGLTIEETQRRVLEEYGFLVPLARDFSVDFRDYRYLKWAIQRYLTVSEWVFFRPLQLTSNGMLEVGMEGNSHGLSLGGFDPPTVLLKYQMIQPANPEPSRTVPPSEGNPPPTANN